MSYNQFNERIIHIIVAGGQLVRGYPTMEDANVNAEKIRTMQPNTKVIVVPVKFMDNQCIDSLGAFNRVKSAW